MSAVPQKRERIKLLHHIVSPVIFQNPVCLLANTYAEILTFNFHEQWHLPVHQLQHLRQGRNGLFCTVQAKLLQLL